MTDSGRDGGKRERLVGGARELLHQQGVERTTLAQIAHTADVPPGNVYYYFKTKDELVEAAIAAHAGDLEAALAEFDGLRTPRSRLKALVRIFGAQAELAARHGCPHGSLCQEVDKRDDELQVAARQLIAIPLDWAERQFRELGRRDARDLAVALMSSYQGASLLANTFRDPDLLVREARRLERWIDTL